MSEFVYFLDCWSYLHAILEFQPQETRRKFVQQRVELSACFQAKTTAKLQLKEILVDPVSKKLGKFLLQQLK